MGILSDKKNGIKTSHSDSKIIFIIGLGRSGTHLLGYVLRAYPDIRVTIEEQPMFELTTKMALNPALRAHLFSELVESYQLEYSKSVPFHYADKSHPNIWLAEDLARVFPNALFVGTWREPFATVASMLKHEGVLKWHRRWKEFPVPNPFLGITSTNVDEYEMISMAAKCALRWKSHAERIEYLTTILKSQLHMIIYEDLVNNTRRELKKLSEFLSLSTPTRIPEIKRGSIDRWRRELSDETCAEITQVVDCKHDMF